MKQSAEMVWISLSVVLVAVALFFLARRLEKGKPGRTDFPYQKVAALFSPAERSFLGVLQQAVGNNAAIFGKVRVADVLEPKKGLGRSAKQTALNKISNKHFDFLLCDKEDVSVACVIELDDGSPTPKGRHTEDEFLKRACEAAGIPLVRIPAQSACAVSEVQRLLPRYLTTVNTSGQGPRPSPVLTKPETVEKICPNCSAAMVKRVARKGRHAGKLFWACSAFPECRTVEAISPSS